MNGGASYEIYDLPQYEAIISKLGYNPYDTLERMYQEEDTVHMVIGQGDDGDYVRNGNLLTGLFASQDGIHFSFVKEMEDAIVEAG